MIPEPPQLMPIDFGESLLYEGHFAQAHCIVQKGNRPITFQWLFNGKELEISQDMEVLNVGKRSSVLTLDPVRLQYQGTYTCLAFNKVGSAHASAELIVNGIPVIIMSVLKQLKQIHQIRFPCLLL